MPREIAVKSVGLLNNNHSNNNNNNSSNNNNTHDSFRLNLEQTL